LDVVIVFFFAAGMMIANGEKKFPAALVVEVDARCSSRSPSSRALEAKKEKKKTQKHDAKSTKTKKNLFLSFSRRRR
jgi:hypothetical protein